MRLFRELFTGFNERYDKLSQGLREIVACGRARDEAHAQTIIDYFNLCGEEYLFFSEGNIHREAWRSGCTGMLCYFEHGPFSKRMGRGKGYQLVLRTVSGGHSTWGGLAGKHPGSRNLPEDASAKGRRASSIPVIGEHWNRAFVALLPGESPDRVKCGAIEEVVYEVHCSA
jgi:hypothetical protein